MKTIKQSELSEKLGVSGAWLSQFFSKKRSPSKDLCIKLEKRSGISRADWMFKSPTQIKRQIELALGQKINNKRGRCSR